MPTTASFLGLEGLHVLVTGVVDDVGYHVVKEFLDQGCKVTAHPHFPLEIFALNEDSDAQLNIITDNLYEESTTPTFEQASKRFGPVNILIVNASITDESTEYPGQDMSLDTWEDCLVNVRGSLLTIKHFLQTTKESQDLHGRELDNLSIVLTGRKQKEHTLAKPANAALQFGLVTAVNNDIVRINSNARINLITFDCSNNSYSQMTRPGLVARSIAFLASHRAAGHISGQAVSFDEHREGFLVWKQNKVLKTAAVAPGSHTDDVFVQAIPISLPKPKGNKIRIAVSVDLDAVSGWLGTGKHSDNILADYSSGIFAAKVGVPRLLRMLKKLDLANRCTWFIPGHSAESFPEEVREVVNSGCEIGLHGYAHEGAYQLTIEQERDVLTKCIDFATRLSGKRPVGYRAPLYQLRESTLDLLEEFGFEYDASLTDHDCHPFFAPRRCPIKPIDFSRPASSWMHPLEQPNTDRRPLVCVPCNWYMEDMTPLQYLPHVHNSHGYVDVRVIENLWRDRFLWIRENEEEPIFPILMHPDTSGMAHVIGMLERMLTWLKGWGDEVMFCQTGEIAKWWREKEG